MSKRCRLRFLIMEHLSSDGRHIMLPDLQQNVSIDALDLRVGYSNATFDNALRELIKDQYVVNLDGRVIATHMGLVKSKIL